MSETFEDKKNIVYLDEDEAEAFKIFIQYSKIWNKLFNEPPENAKVILHFDGNGVLKMAEYPTIIRG